MIVPIPQFTSPSYGDRTANEVQRCVNLMPERTEKGWKLVSTPGLNNFGTTANDLACRGMYPSTTGKCFSAHGTVIYETASNGVATSRGTMSGSTGAVYMADNGTSLFIVDSGSGACYTLTMASGSVTAVPDANCPSATMVTFQDGYFIVSKTGTGEFYLSQLYDGADWTPIQFATAESKGDILVGVFSNGTNLYLIGTKTVEIWYNTGNADFPFERISGSTLQFGCATGAAVANINGTLYFIGSSAGGKGSVWEISGTAPKQVSTPYIESQISLLNLSGVYGFCYQINGHTLYQITGTNEGKTFVYDIGQGTWFQKESFVSSAYTYDRLRFVVNVFDGSFANPVGADNYNGKLYQVGGSYTTPVNAEDATAIRRVRVFGPIGDGSKRIFHNHIRFVFEAAYDFTPGTTFTGATIDWSDDDGRTFSTAVTPSVTIAATTTGQIITVEHRRIGSSKKRFYRLTISGILAGVILENAFLDAQEGRF